MLFYTILLFLIICSSSIVTYEKNLQVVNLFKLITFCLFFLPAAFRYNVGVDYQNYIDLFYEINVGGRADVEPGYWFLNHIVYKYGGSAQLVLAISAFITLFFFFRGVEKKCWLVYSIVFFIICWPWYCSTVRQMMACAFAFYAWRKNNKGQYLISFIFIGLACLFHYSSFMYPIIFLISNRVHLSKMVLIGIFISCVLLCLSGILGNNILNMLANTYYGDRYANSVWLDVPEVSSGLGRLLRFSLYLVILYFLPNDTPQNQSIQMLFFLYVITDVMSSEVIILNRIGRGFIFISLVAVYQIVCTRRFFRPIIISCIFTMLATLLYANLMNGFVRCSPYMSVFSHI